MLSEQPTPGVPEQQGIAKNLLASETPRHILSVRPFPMRTDTERPKQVIAIVSSVIVAVVAHFILIAVLTTFPAPNTASALPRLTITVDRIQEPFIEDETLGRLEFCEVHDVKMSIALMMSGEQRPDPQVPATVHSSRFPNAQPVPNQGMRCGSGGPSYTRLYVCPDCDQAKRSWRFEKLRQGFSQIKWD